MKSTSGFIANPKRFNVAITRAMALSVIVGNPVHGFGFDPCLKSLLAYCCAHDACAGYGMDAAQQDELRQFYKEKVLKEQHDPYSAHGAFLNDELWDSGLGRCLPSCGRSLSWCSYFSGFVFSVSCPPPPLSVLFLFRLVVVSGVFVSSYLVLAPPVVRFVSSRLVSCSV
jgi:hypothetical protein